MGRELHGCNGGAIGATDDVGGSRAVSRRGNDFTYALYALSFDGINDTVDFGNVTFLDSLSTFTIEFWLYPESASAAFASYLAKLQSSTYEGFNFSAGSDATSMRFHGLGGNNAISGAVTLGTWAHIAGGYDGSNMFFYIDGVLIGTLALASIDLVNNEPMKMGMLNYYGEYTGSKMADVRFWDHARTQTQIQNNANTKLNGVETGLVAYYPTDSGSGTTLVDNAGNNDGTINGATWVERSAFPTT